MLTQEARYQSISIVLPDISMFEWNSLTINEMTWRKLDGNVGSCGGDDKHISKPQTNGEDWALVAFQIK